MTELILFHHAQGLTDGVRAFADELRAAGHVVHTPDLYEGKTFTELADGVANARQVGFGTIIERGATRRRELAERGGVRRLLARRAPCADACSDAARCQRSPALSLRDPDLRVRRPLAARRPPPDPHDGRRPGGLTAERRPRGRPSSGHDDRPRRALPLLRRRAPLR